MHQRLGAPEDPLRPFKGAQLPAHLNLVRVQSRHRGLAERPDAGPQPQRRVEVGHAGGAGGAGGAARPQHQPAHLQARLGTPRVPLQRLPEQPQRLVQVAGQLLGVRRNQPGLRPAGDASQAGVGAELARQVGQRHAVASLAEQIGVPRRAGHGKGVRLAREGIQRPRAVGAAVVGLQLGGRSEVGG